MNSAAFVDDIICWKDGGRFINNEAIMAAAGSFKGAVVDVASSSEDEDQIGPEDINIVETEFFGSNLHFRFKSEGIRDRRDLVNK
uniref:Uncharacterized protein n=1 Tax=Romanomermis culicivorax TaxID=13658 RepID=A0A915HKT3_ROMCU